MRDDEAAFTALFEAHYDSVLRYGRRRTDEQTARDVAAETFLVAWRRGVPDDDPLPWLYGVARNCLANAARSSRRETRALPRLAGPSATPDHADASNDATVVRAALALLPERDREALLLVTWEDLPTRAAARAAGCSESAFAVRLHRARKRLAALLEPRLPTEIS
ncbi:MAG TPA: RNA polymerase sigma factor [Frankiaceae bacterium]|nr:RNA polymerase sigma factor [Frankiaceae bacterium]